MGMSVLFALTHRTGVRLAEVGFLLIVIAGLWLAAAQAPLLGRRVGRTLVAGLLLAAGGVLLIVATHWAGFG
jgi:hypothetical protein